MDLDSLLNCCSLKYHNVDVVKRDIKSTLAQYRGLFPKVEKFVFNNGMENQYINLSGVIPVPYKGSMYNIPICVWIFDTHPYNAPLCYVRPTADMEIRVSRNVDQNGKVYLPYLHEWKPMSSDVLSLIQVMIAVFGEYPPVYSKPKNTMQTQFQAPYQRAVKPGYPLPNNHGTSGGMGYPPYPNQSYSMPTANPVTPYPPMPNYSSGSNPPYPATTTTPYPLYPPSTPYPNTPYPVTSGNSVGNTGTITEEHIQASLLSAVEDKVRRRLQEKHQQVMAETEVLKRTQADLNMGKTKVESILCNLEKEQVILNEAIETMKEKQSELDGIIESMEQSQEVDVDSIVDVSAPLFKQLLSCYAEENATQDAIYYLGDALRKGVIDLDVFLKHVRSLSRQQFILRAKMLKCRLKAGLA